MPELKETQISRVCGKLTFLKYHSTLLGLLCGRSIQNTREKWVLISTSGTMFEIDFYFIKKYAQKYKGNIGILV